MQIKDKPLKPTNSPSRDSQIDTHEDDLLQYPNLVTLGDLLQL